MIWFTMIIMGLMTYSIRLSFILLGDRLNLSPTVRKALEYVPISVLSAYAIPQFIYLNGEMALRPSNPRIWAGLIVILVAYKTKNVLLTIIIGLITLWIAQSLLL